jgi:hypothetical protein
MNFFSCAFKTHISHSWHTNNVISNPENKIINIRNCNDERNKPQPHTHQPSLIKGDQSSLSYFLSLLYFSITSPIVIFFYFISTIDLRTCNQKIMQKQKKLHKMITLFCVLVRSILISQQNESNTVYIAKC